MKRLLLALCSCFALVTMNAQIPIGAFKSYLPYNQFTSVAVSDDKVYAAANQSVMYLEKKNNSLHTWSTVEGLSDVNVARLEFNRETNTLLIAYSNGNLDLIKDDVLTNVPDIKLKQFTGSKRIYHVEMYGHKAYLSTAFGIVIVNLDNQSIEDTWFSYYQNSYLSIHQTLFKDNDIYVTTDRGLFKKPINAFDIADFASWIPFPNTLAYDFTFSTFYGGFFYFVAQRLNEPDSLFCMENNGVVHFVDCPETNVTALKSDANHFVVCGLNDIYFYKTESQIEYHAVWSNYWGRLENISNLAFDNDDIWFSSLSTGILKFNFPQRSCEAFSENGPYTYMVEAIDIQNGKMATVPGTRSGRGSSFVHPSVSSLFQGKWSNVEKTFYDFGVYWDINNVAINPRNINEIYCTSWGCGMFKIENDRVVAHYDGTNSPLKSSGNSIYISGLCYDQNNNLWITNTDVQYPLHVLKSDGTWKSFTLTPQVSGSSDCKVEHVMVDSRGYKWMNFPRGLPDNPLLAVFDDNHTIDNQGDDRIARVEVNYIYSEAEPASSAVTAIAEDLDGAIWLGTDGGIKVLYYPENVFTQTNVFYPQYIVVTQNGYNGLLLGNDRINAIAVDGANRKWIGTESSGIFLISANGREELLHFTTDNSPLFSNNITTIAIDKETGEVFIGTTYGLISYMGDATFGKEAFEECKVFPNPVREDYHGTIAVRGLMENALCKIVDAEGKLVWQGYANGGELVWNGHDHRGTRPATGVYYVLMVNPEGKEKKVAKFLMIH